MSRPITGTVYKPDGTAWASGTVRARLVEPFETSTRVYPKTEITITLDSNGEIPANTQLDTPDTGTAHYIITTPDKVNYTVYLDTGLAVDLVTLLTIAGTAVAQDELQTLLDAAAVFTITNATTTHTVAATDEYIRCSGTFAVNLPAATGSGRLVIVNNIGSGNITVTADGSDLIRNAATKVLYPNGSACFVDAAAATWDCIGAYHE